MPSRTSSTRRRKPEQLGLELVLDGSAPALPRAGARAGRAPRVPALVAGVDEAGRGPLAGPVVAAAVILDELQPIRGLADSKQLSPARRERLFDEIRAKALCLSIAQASPEEIDRLNILQATLLAMQRAVAGLRLRPVQVLVDGNRVPQLDLPVRAIVQGDATVAAISAASILAKVQRDRLCTELDRLHPAFGFATHKGYPTPEHLAVLRRLGPCAAHRHSFAPVRAALQARAPGGAPAPGVGPGVDPGLGSGAPAGDGANPGPAS